MAGDHAAARTQIEEHTDDIVNPVRLGTERGARESARTTPPKTADS